jgi:hypothetical protein
VGAQSDNLVGQDNPPARASADLGHPKFGILINRKGNNSCSGMRIEVTGRFARNATGRTSLQVVARLAGSKSCAPYNLVQV